MVTPAPGDFIQYALPESNFVLWPAVVCTDEMATQKVGPQPHKDYKLILLMGKLELRWASAGETQEHLTPQEPTTIEDEQLRIAYEMVDEAWDSCLTLDYWSDVINNHRASDHSDTTPTSNGSLSPDTDSESDPDFDEDDDDDIKLAKIISKAEAKGKKPVSLKLPTPQTSSTKKQKLSPLVSSVSPTSYDSPFSKSEITPRQRVAPSIRSKEPNRSKNNRPALPGTLPEMWESKHLKAMDSWLSVKRKPAFSEFYQDAKATMLPIDGEMDQHSELVKFVIGQQKREFYIPKAAIDKRDYFSSRTVGSDCVVDTCTGWTYQRRCCENFEPDDFEVVAEYLQTGDFGCRIFENDGQRKHTFEQCAAAWNIAVELGATDLLEFIVMKVELTRPWEPMDALAFGAIVYQTGIEGTLLPAHGNMKDILVDFVARHYSEYLGKHPTAFGEHMTGIPDFLDDVTVRRATILETAREGYREKSQGGNPAVVREEQREDAHGNVGLQLHQENTQSTKMRLDLTRRF
ncbi:hypothetical protein K504DRAFT_531579 [Pleomassaria siparia CBS 279.74]|uniref:PWWP domain-containing protein n=1 Tax=Pleomassaria siparia CBS 279.74 TaxID=1314801 RepID=A0A6G1KI16_9PLEO|nr:hypothetical protein K504DRAFT_531579 [Pleomassaria siparia CBS 279.74]